jgi:hypothetical protein
MREGRGGIFCRKRHGLPAKAGVPKMRRPSFHWAFGYGMAFAGQRRPRLKRSVGNCAMLPAIGAASLVLDAVQSLTSPAPSSSPKPTDAFGPALTDITDNLPASSPIPPTVSGFGGGQISSDNISTLLDAQSLSSAGDAFGGANSTSDSSQAPAASAPGAASSAYHAINQLTQSTALPLGLNPFSVSV